MATLADPSWVEYWIELGDVHILDPRPASQYAQGHLPDAVSLPLEKILGPDGFLLPDHRLAQAFGEAGLDDSKRALVYDGGDGRQGAMMAWVLEYLGRGEVSLSSLLYEGWVQQGYAVSREAVTPQRRHFNTRINPNKRVSLEELGSGKDVKLLDVRSAQEHEGPGGHLPGSFNLPWTEFLGSDHYLLRSDADLSRRLKTLGIHRMEKIVTYSNTGPRAAIGYLALKRGGYDVSVLDAAFPHRPLT